MMWLTLIAPLCLLGFAAAQTSLTIASCLTKEQNLRMVCTFTPAPTPDPKQSVCSFTSDTKLVASSDASAVPDNLYKNRGEVKFDQKACQLDLNGFSNDKPQNFTCSIKQTATGPPALKLATVEKSKLATCSAWCILQHSAVVFLLVFLTSPLTLELL
nr:thy-1 membrane glycoprotein [Misgurnus anguillicaudatus]